MNVDTTDLAVVNHILLDVLVLMLKQKGIFTEEDSISLATTAISKFGDAQDSQAQRCIEILKRYIPAG